MFGIILMRVGVKMYNYIIGTITMQTASYIVVEAYNVGYTINVANPYSFELGKDYKVFLYNNVKEDEYSLYGFKDEAEREMFLKLINVKGLGPKIAMPMIVSGTIGGLADAIERENILYLTKFPKVGEKLAKQIILDLKGKLNISSNNIIDNSTDELIEVLSSLGYKTMEIKKAIPNVDATKPLEEQIKEALKLMMR